jgi:hypothetical protein
MGKQTLFFLCGSQWQGYNAIGFALHTKIPLVGRHSPLCANLDFTARELAYIPEDIGTTCKRIEVDERDFDEFWAAWHPAFLASSLKYEYRVPRVGEHRRV